MKQPGCYKIWILLVSLVLIISSIGTVSSLEVTSMEDGIVVPYGETVILEDETIFVEGDIDVRGTLILRNVDLILNTTTDSSYIVRDEGVLTVQGSRITSYEDFINRNFTLELKEGYNLLSFPFVRENNNVSSVLSSIDGHYDNVMFYDAWDQDRPWKSYNIYRPDHFNTLKEINRTMGVLVNITEETVIEQEGTLPSTTEITLLEGQNMVGFPLDEPMHVVDAFSDIEHDIQKVEEETPEGRRELSSLERLVPGRGYWITTNNETTWVIDVPYGITYEHALELSKGQGIGFEFEKGSVVSIEDSEVIGSSNPEAKPDFTVRSKEVTFSRNEFIGGSTNILVESASPDIRRSSFIGYSNSAIHIKGASPTVRQNQFSSTRGWGVIVDEGSPTVIDNEFRGHQGVLLNSMDGTVLHNTFINLESTGIHVQGGEPTIEDNVFADIISRAVDVSSSNLVLKKNTFTGVNTGVLVEDSEVLVEDNYLEDVGSGIILRNSNGLIVGNEIRGALSWGVRVSSEMNVTIAENQIYDGSNGVRLSGGDINFVTNDVSNNTGIGMLAVDVGTLQSRANNIHGNDGLGVKLEDSRGAFIDNSVTSNDGGGLWTDSPLWIANNTISRNEVFGLSVEDSDPYVENNTFFLNPLNGLMFKDSSVMISSSSVLGSRYDLYLVRSNVTVIDSFLDPDSVWKDSHSHVSYISRLSVTMEEDTELRDFDLKGLLPPDTSILNVSDHDPIDVEIHEGGIDFIPPENYHGTVNMSFDVLVAGSTIASFPLSLEVTPVNDPPEIDEIDVLISEDSGKVTWLLNYQDVDGYPPTYVEIVIEGDSYTMETIHEGYQDFAYGVTYRFEKYLSPGTYDYYYEAEEYNPLGENITVRSEQRSLEVPSSTAPLLDTLGETLLLLAVIVLSFFIVFKLISGYRDDDDSNNLNIHGENWIEDFSHDEKIFSEDDAKSDGFKELPVLKKKRPNKEMPVLKKKGPKEDIPVLEKKDKTPEKKEKRKYRIVADKEETIDEIEEDGMLIDVVGESQEIPLENEVDVSKSELKRQRRIKQDRERWTIKKKQRATKENLSGKKKRVIKD